jgi:hypothetical protein
VCKSGTSVEQNAAKRRVLDALQQWRIENMRCVLAKLPTLEEVQGVVSEDVDAKRRGLLGRMTSGRDCLPHSLFYRSHCLNELSGFPTQLYHCQCGLAVIVWSARSMRDEWQNKQSLFG